MIGLELYWIRCREGVRFVDYGQAPNLADRAVRLTGEEHGRWIEWASAGQEEAYVRRLDRLDDAMVMQFINAGSDEDLLAFCDEFGLPGTLPTSDHTRSELRAIRSVQKSFQTIFSASERGAAKNKFNSMVQQLNGTALKPSLRSRRGSGELTMTFAPQNPYGYMAMETAMALSGATAMLTCHHCGTAFLAGSATGKRTNAYYCSNRCRVAAQRAAKEN